MKLTTHLLWTKYSILLKVMNLCTDSERKWALESESKPEIEKNICFIMLCPIKILKTLFAIEVNNSSPVDKVINFKNINESLD